MKTAIFAIVLINCAIVGCGTVLILNGHPWLGFFLFLFLGGSYRTSSDE